MSDVGRDILSSMDNFIEKIQHLRGLMLGVSLSALILAPLAIGLSIYLITHPKFFHLVENEGEFAFLLLIFLVVVLVTAGIWLVTGLQQFRSLTSWNRRYGNYLKRREDLDKDISAKFHLDEE
jgi:predicted PurR-regulated permease PerM